MEQMEGYTVCLVFVPDLQFTVQYTVYSTVVAFASSVTFHAETRIIFGTGRAELL